MVAIRSVGIYVLLLYAAYNMINILYIYAEISTFGALIALGSLYFVVRVFRFLGNKGGLYQAELIGYLFLFMFIVVLVLQSIFHLSAVDKNGLDINQNIFTLSQVGILWFFIGGACANFKIKQSNVVALLISISVTVAMYMATDENLTIPFSTIRDEQELGGGLSHLTLEKNVVFLLVFAFALATKFRLVCVLLSLLALFFMGGRTSLFVFLTAALLLHLRTNILVNLFVVSIIAVVGIYAFQYGVSTGYINPDSKAVRDILFLDGVAEDGSYLSRVDIMKEGISLLPDQLLIGNFSLTTDQQGYFGAYIHNLLSAWQFYGMFVFLALVACLAYSAKRMFFALKKSKECDVIFGSFLLIYVVISVILSKYVAWHLLWFILGFWLLRFPESLKVNRTSSGNRSRRKRGRRHRKVSNETVLG